MQRSTLAQLRSDKTLDPDFSPSYSPYEQRMCLCPDGDFYECLRNGSASIKTGLIETVDSKGVRLKSEIDGVDADIIVTATGLALKIGGGIRITVDGSPFRIPDHYVWKGIMIEDLPNLAFAFGYIDLSWTLGVDISAKLTCKVLKQMQESSLKRVVPRRSSVDKSRMKDKKFMPLASTYVRKAESELPKVGDRQHWRPRSRYLWELFTMNFGNISSGLDCSYNV